MVDVSSQNNSVSINVSSSGNSASIKASPDTAQYYSEKSREWATSDKLIDGKDYSSKYYAGKSSENATIAESYANAAEDTFNNVQVATETSLANIETARVDAVDNITTVKNESIASVEAKGNEASALVDTGIANINTAKTEAVNAVTSTKTTILNDIEFVADGEKKEINELADVIKDNANTVNIAIEAGVERLNSIDALKNNQITNCLLEVPQRIKYELNEGTLTIKAGSVVIVPYGTEDLTTQYPVGATFLHENFKVYDTQYEDGKFFVWMELVSDTMFSDLKDGDFYLVAHLAKGSINRTTFKEYVYSGDTAPTTNLSAGVNWYDTANNITKTNDGTANFTPYIMSLPSGLITISGSDVTIAQVFNGMGYMGSTVWVDKGVKGLIPNGRNEDGTLRNIEWTTENILLRNNTESGPYYLAILDGGTRVSIAGKPNWYFDEKSNRILGDGIIKDNIGFYGDATLATGGVITSFDPKQPFRAVDYSEFNKSINTLNKAYITETYVNGASGYRTWSDKYHEEWGAITQNSGFTHTVTFLKRFKDTKYQVYVCTNYNAKGSSGTDYFYNKTVSGCGFVTQNVTGTANWRASGYIA